MSNPNPIRGKIVIEIPDAGMPEVSFEGEITPKDLKYGTAAVRIQYGPQYLLPRKLESRRIRAEEEKLKQQEISDGHEERDTRDVEQSGDTGTSESSDSGTTVGDPGEPKQEYTFPGPPEPDTADETDPDDAKY